MAKLVDIYRSEKDPVIKQRQLPLVVNDNLTVRELVMHFDIRRFTDIL